jgi:CRP-like cAMP-binding protein
MLLDKKYQNVMRNNSLFKGLDEEYFKQVVDSTSICKLKVDEVLFRQQQSATDFFLLVDGRIKLSLLSIEGTEKVVDIIAPGTTFAEAIILNGMKGYPVNAVALLDTNVLRINAEVFTSILHSSPKTCIKVMASLSLRLHSLMTEIDRLSLHNATYRLVSYLLEDIPLDTQESTEIKLQIPKHVVASRISVTPETLSRTLKRLCKEGYLEVSDRHIVLLKPAELRRLVSI